MSTGQSHRTRRFRKQHWTEHPALRTPATSWQVRALAIGNGHTGQPWHRTPSPLSREGVVAGGAFGDDENLTAEPTSFAWSTPWTPTRTRP